MVVLVVEPLVVRLRMKENFSMEEIHSLIILGKLQSSPLMFGGNWILHSNISEL